MRPSVQSYSVVCASSLKLAMLRVAAQSLGRALHAAELGSIMGSCNRVAASWLSSHHASLFSTSSQPTFAPLSSRPTFASSATTSTSTSATDAPMAPPVTATSSPTTSPPSDPTAQPQSAAKAPPQPPATSASDQPPAKAPPQVQAKTPPSEPPSSLFGPRKVARLSGGRPVRDTFTKSEGIVHINNTRNNLMLVLTDTDGAVKAWTSAGSMGFKNSRKVRGM
eukprot:gene14239-20211_t